MPRKNKGTMNRSSTIIDKPMESTDQAVNISETSEQVIEEAPKLSRKEIVIQMQFNAKSEIERIQDDSEALDQFISEKRYQERVLIEQRDQATQERGKREGTFNEAVKMVTSEKSRMQLAKGIPEAEAEHAAILQSLTTVQGQAEKDLALAAERETQAQEKVTTLVPRLREQIAEAQGKIAELAQEKRDMEALLQEQHRAY